MADVYPFDYERLLQLQKDFEDGKIDDSDLTMTEMKALVILYKKQISELDKEIAEKRKRIWMGK